MIECFGNIVGTTRDEPSDSYLWITDLEAVASVEGLINEESSDIKDDIIDELNEARRHAIMTFTGTLQTLLMRYFKPIPGFSGVIGGTSWTKAITESGKSGIRVLCRDVNDAEMVLKGINAYFKETGALTLKVASNYSDEIKEFQIETKANKRKYNDLRTTEEESEPINLSFPLSSDIIPGCVEYYIYHENEVAPLNTKISCATCGTFRFNAKRPDFKRHGYKSFANIAGFNTKNIDTMSPENGSVYNRGIQPILDIKCRTDKVICRDGINFETNPMAMSYAIAIQYKAGSVLVWNMLRNPKLNRVLMEQTDDVREAASYYERKYNDMLKYIAKHMEVDSDCLCETGFSDIKIGRP